MSQDRYPNLFSPIKVKNKTFKNRILVSPMGLNEPSGDEPGVLTKDGINFYRRIAAGGSARICTAESDVVYGSAVSGRFYFMLDEMPELLVSRMHEYVDMCHEYGALAFVSFDHMGAYARTKDTMAKLLEKQADQPDDNRPKAPPKVYRKDGTEYTYPDKAYGPSELTINEPYDGITSRLLEMDNDNGKHVYEMDEQQMNEIADAFAHCASNAKACGLDGMVIHAGHGFMFSQWISRRFNKRTDKYGGSMENRARFPIMCLKRIREAVGDDFLIEMRFSAEENISPICEEEFIPDVVTIDETVEFFKEVDKYPGLLDIAHITGGLHTVPVYNIRTTANSYFPMAPNLKGAAAVKAAVKNIKVGVVGSLSDPDLCESIIREGKADFVIMCRQLLMADPEFPNKAKSGHPEEINNCLRCVICHNNGHCAVNPEDIMLGEKDPLKLKTCQKGKNIGIVGGGIAGMKAAEYAAQSGHKVTLYEKEDCLGGVLNYTEHDQFKQDIRRFKNNMIARLNENPDVTIKLGILASPENMKKENFDCVILACGGNPAPMNVPGGNEKIVLDAVYAYNNSDKVGQKVVVIGGGLTGCEAAIHWASVGRQVTLISRSPVLMKNVKPRMPADGSPDTHLILIHRYKIDVRKGCACKSVQKDGVIVKDDSSESFIPADTVINASGMRANSEIYKEYENCAAYVKAIGDVNKIGMIGDAVLSARQTIVDINQECS